MSQHKDVTIPITLVVAAFALPRLLPDWGILERLLPSSSVYSWQIPAIQILTIVILFLVPYWIYQSVAISPHIKERSILYKVALETINARNRLTNEISCKLNACFKENGYALNCSQRSFIRSLVKSVFEVTTDNEELEDRHLPEDKRKALVAHRRTFLNKVENCKSKIEKYQSKNT